METSPPTHANPQLTFDDLKHRFFRSQENDKNYLNNWHLRGSREKGNFGGSFVVVPLVECVSVSVEMESFCIFHQHLEPPKETFFRHKKLRLLFLMRRNLHEGGGRKMCGT